MDTYFNLFIRGFRRKEEFPESSYLRDIPALQKTVELSFHEPVTFFIGENGTGKSTLLEAIAAAYGFNPEGGTRNYSFSTYDDYSDLYERIVLFKGAARPRTGYFLRAESFYNVATAAMQKYNDDGQMQDFHAMSHGESFLAFIEKADSGGLYLMDEPEAALSPQKQLVMMRYIADLSKRGCQFIIATHSPILMALPEAEILMFDENGISPCAYEDTDSYKITRLFLTRREMMLEELLKE